MFAPLSSRLAIVIAALALMAPTAQADLTLGVELTSFGEPFSKLSVFATIDDPIETLIFSISDQFGSVIVPQNIEEGILSGGGLIHVHLL